MKGIYNIIFNEENGKTEVTVVSLFSPKPIASSTSESPWAAAVDAITDALLIEGVEVK